MQGLLTVFDYVRGAPSHVLDMHAAICSLAAHAQSDVLALGLSNGTVSLVRAADGSRTDTAGMPAACMVTAGVSCVLCSGVHAFT